MSSGVSFIVPVHNEAAILEDNCLSLLGYIRKLETPFELIIGSNGSTDATDTIGQHLAESYREIKFFSLPQRGVVGTVFKKAIKMSRYEKIISLDVDLTIDLSFINNSSRLLDTYDLVIGSKKAGKELRSWVRRLGSNIYIWVVRKFLGLEYSDYSIGAKAYRRSAILPHLNKIDEKTGYVLTLVYHLYKNEGQIVQIPVECHDQRESKFRLLREGFYRFAHLFTFRLRQ